MAHYKNIHNKSIYKTPKLETIQNTIRDWINKSWHIYIHNNKKVNELLIYTIYMYLKIIIGKRCHAQKGT